MSLDPSAESQKKTNNFFQSSTNTKLPNSGRVEEIMSNEEAEQNEVPQYEDFDEGEASDQNLDNPKENENGMESEKKGNEVKKVSKQNTSENPNNQVTNLKKTFINSKNNKNATTISNESDRFGDDQQASFIGKNANSKLPMKTEDKERLVQLQTKQAQSPQNDLDISIQPYSFNQNEAEYKGKMLEHENESANQRRQVSHLPALDNQKGSHQAQTNSKVKGTREIKGEPNSNTVKQTKNAVQDKSALPKISNRQLQVDDAIAQQYDHKKVKEEEEDHDDHPKEDLDAKFDEPLHPFGVSRNQLIRIASAAQQRHFAEEVDMLESLGGIQKLQKGLLTDFKKGIFTTTEDHELRNRAFGNNLQEISIPKGILQLFFDALDDFTMKILMVAAVLSIAIEVGTAEPSHRSTAWIEGFAVLIAVFVCSSVTAVNDYQKERQFQELNNEADKRKIITIFKNGQKENHHQSIVMVGDIIDLTEGMEVPADGILVEASELTTDESAMTGETDPLKKNLLADCIKKRDEIIEQGAKNTSTTHDVPSPVLLSGTKILTGQGKMLVIVVGEYSCVGKISKLLNSKETEATPLQEKLEAIAMDIGGLGLKSAIVIVLVLLLRFAIEKIVAKTWDNSHDWAEMLSFFIIGITVVVVAIPEGLPLSVTLSLAYSVKKMLKENNLVRKLQACETMGGADCICSDKTGTLTQNKMTLTTWWNEEMQEFNKYDDRDKIENYISNTQPAFQKLFLQQCAINCNADLRPDEKGSKTEVAALKLIEKFDEKYEIWREKYAPELTFPFSSARKRMSSVIHSDGKRILLVKGASEMVLASCNKFLSKKTGQIRPIDEQLLATMKASIKTMADNALRTIVLGYKELKDDEDMTTKDRLGVFDVETKNLICFAIFGIKDILRAEVPDAVKQCQDAGIKVRMITGDNRDTAKAIARDCNILTKENKASPYQVIEGGIVCKKCNTAECECVRDQETATKEGKTLRIDTIKNGEVFDKIYQQIEVMARSRPEDKYAMVVGLIERKHVVAVTGDGTNDAPALKKADVGFAMGIAGTEVARGAAAIILLDDNFKSIVSAVLWGRNIYDSIKKFLQFQLTVNIVAVVITLVGAAAIKQQILTPIQMLWINLIMDTFASLALATEPPIAELLLRKPHNRDEYIVSKKMFKHIFGQSLYQLAVMMLLVFKGETFLPEVADSWDDEIKDNTLFRHWWEVKYSNEARTLVRSGRLRSFSGTDKEYQLVIDKFSQPSRHFTAIFNIFVWMQIFNFLNARKLQDELNIFEGISRNPLFFLIVFIIVLLQAILIQIGSIPFSCYKGGLNGGNWGISVAFGFGSLLWGLFLKFISEEKCAQFGKKQILSLKGNRQEASMSRRYSALIQHPVPKH